MHERVPDLAGVPAQLRAPRAAAASPLTPLGAKVDDLRAQHREALTRAAWNATGAGPPARRPPHRWQRRYVTALVAVDAALAAGVAALASAGPRLAGVLAVGFVGCLTAARVYEHRFLGQGLEEFRRLATAAVTYVAVTTLVAYALASPHRGLVLLAVPGTALGALVVHVVARELLLASRRRGLCLDRVLVIGLERSVAELVRAVRADPAGGLRVVGACVTQARAESVESVPVLGPASDAVEAIVACGADTVLLTAWSDVSEADLRRLSWALEGSGVRLLVAPRLTEVSVPRLHVQTVHGRPLLVVDEPEFTGVRRVAKAALDYGLTLAGLAVLAPLLVGVALAVGLTSPGPVFFRQERVGRGSTTFRMTKFRSMYVDAEARRHALEHLNDQAGGPLFKMRDDPRVTPVGRVLRRFSLDELPQLFDVLAGRMSLVGPRPPLPREVAVYEGDTHRRLLVKPGITGLWQVSGRSDLSWDETVRLDLSYVENWSLLLDLSIILRTVGAVLSRRGAY